jgi:hypothetical protein
MFSHAYVLGIHGGGMSLDALEHTLDRMSLEAAIRVRFNKTFRATEYISSNPNADANSLQTLCNIDSEPLPLSCL